MASVAKPPYEPPITTTFFGLSEDCMPTQSTRAARSFSASHRLGPLSMERYALPYPELPRILGEMTAYPLLTRYWLIGLKAGRSWASGPPWTLRITGSVWSWGAFLGSSRNAG